MVMVSLRTEADNEAFAFGSTALELPTGRPDFHAFRGRSPVWIGMRSDAKSNGPSRSMISACWVVANGQARRVIVGH
jgi:hypothetical protein